MGLKTRIKGLIDILFWRNVSEHPSIIYLLKRTEKPFENDIPTFENNELNVSFLDDNRKWFHNEFIIEIAKPVVIEPDYGNVIIGLNKIVQQSIYFPKLRPSFFRFLKNRVLKMNTFQEEAILFDVFVGENYFHFFSDIINKIWVLEKQALNQDRPIVIGESIYSLEYFQYLMKISSLKDKNWYVLQKNEYLKVNHLYLCRAMPYNLDHWRKTLTLFDLPPNKQRRIFLTRSQQSGRCITNFDELQPVLQKYHFEIIDTMGKTLEYQKNMFSESDCIIAIHGAGETNMMFSYKNNPKLLEINPSNRVACHYYWLSLMFKFRYDCIVGGELKKTPNGKDGFAVNVDLLEISIEKMIQA